MKSETHRRRLGDEFPVSVKRNKFRALSPTRPAYRAGEIGWIFLWLESLIATNQDRAADERAVKKRTRSRRRAATEALHKEDARRTSGGIEGDA